MKHLVGECPICNGLIWLYRYGDYEKIINECMCIEIGEYDGIQNRY